MLRPATIFDCMDVIIRLDPEKRAELEEAHGIDDLAVTFPQACNLKYTFVDSDKDGLNYVLFGVHPTETDRVGQAWMIATPEFLDNLYPFVRQSKAQLRWFAQHYDLVYTHMDESSHGDRRWITWLGFQIVTRHRIRGKTYLEMAQYLKEE